MTTITFRAKIFGCVDLFSDLKGEKAGAERVVSKRLVLKWNRNRNEMKAEFKGNKQKENTGGVKVTRPRRKVVGDKTKNREKYPLNQPQSLLN